MRIKQQWPIFFGHMAKRLLKEDKKMNFTKMSILSAFILVAVSLNIRAECFCPEPGEEPYVPCGYCEGEYEMEYSRREIKTYLKMVNTTNYSNR